MGPDGDGGGFIMELSIGDRVFYTTSTRLRVPAKVVGLWHDGHVELECDQGGVQAVNHRCSMDSISFGIPSLESQQKRSEDTRGKK